MVSKTFFIVEQISTSLGVCRHSSAVHVGKGKKRTETNLSDKVFRLLLELLELSGHFDCVLCGVRLERVLCD